MFKQIISSAIILLVMSAWTPAAVIDVGTHYLLPNDVRTIPITVSGGDQVRALDFFIQVADGGSDNLGSATIPVITGIDIVGPGTIFSQSNRGSQPTSTPDGLIWMDSTATQPGVTIAASGTLAYVTVDTTNTTSSDPPYALSLTNVLGNIFPPDGYNTDFGDITPEINEGQIVIVDLHDMVWNKSASGVWTEHTWTGPLPPYPNYTARAIVDTHYTVTVNDAEEANKLTLSNGGQVSIGAAGTLSLTTGVAVSSGGAISFASGAKLTATGITLDNGSITGSGSVNPAVTINANGGTLSTPLSGDNLILESALGGTGGLTKSGPGTATLLDNAVYQGPTSISAGRLQLDGANSSLHAITGNGTLGIGDGIKSSILTAESVNVDVLTLAPGSVLVIAPIAGGPLSNGVFITPVPEPSTPVLVAIACLFAGLYICVFPKFNHFFAKCKINTP